jgi:gluconolactonase
VAAGSGALSNPTLFTTTAANPDGMAIDVLGNLFVATSAGVQASSRWPARRWGVIPVPRAPSNIAWGDADRRTLYITAEDRLYSVRVVNAGVRD